MQRGCPICKTLTDSETNTYFPFCSDRCRVQDLGNWSAEKYAVSEPLFDESEDKPNEAPNPDDTIH